MDQIDPPLQPNEEGWFDRYHEHLRRRAAGEVGPIKTIPKIRNTPIGPAGPIPPLDTKLLVTSKPEELLSPYTLDVQAYQDSMCVSE